MLKPWRWFHALLNRSIRRQLVFGIAAVHAVLMSIFVVDLVTRQSRFLHEQALTQAESLAETLAANSTSWVLANDVAGLEEVLRSQSKYRGLSYAMVLSPEGQVLGHSDKRHAGQYVSDPVSLSLFEQTEGPRVLIDSRELIDVAAPVLANGQLIGWARVALDQAGNVTALRRIFSDGLIYTVVAITVGVVFALFMAGGLTRGLRQIVRVSTRIRDGERRVRAGLGREDELGMLARDFDRMLDVLEAKEAEIEHFNARLVESEERFELALRGSTDGLWDWDAETGHTYYSTRWKQMLGYTNEEIEPTERAWSSRVHPDDIAVTQRAIKVHLSGETPFYESVHRTRHKDGSWRWHLERGVAVRDERGKVVRMVGTTTDITERKRAEEVLYAEKERALVTLNSIGDAVITTDDRGIIDFMNPVAEQLTGWTLRESVGKPLDGIFRVINEETRKPCDNPVTFCLSEGKVVGLEGRILLVDRQGGEIAIEDSAAPIRDSEGRIIGVVMVFHDVTEARDLAQQMSWQATHDALTGLINRAEFDRRLHDALLSARERGEQHAVLYMDLDQFKLVNDTCGHVAGDELLRQLSFILQGQVRTSDTLARLGGDEFGLLLAGCPLEQARLIADDLRQAIKDFRFAWDEKTFELGASLGLVQVDAHSENISAILSAADVACYAAKDLGRNRVHVYEPHDTDLEQRRGEMQWVARINEALVEHRLVLYCQSLRDTRHDVGEMVEHVEVLVRMRNCDGSLVPPAAFIPAAERYGLMPSVDRWVVRNTCRFIRRVLDERGESALRMVAINLSGSTLSDEDFLEFVTERLVEYRVPPDLICFEITETAAIAHLTKANQFIREMKRVGCRFALDDFGSGLSSFGYLKNLPVDYLKIDGSFIRDLVHDPIDLAMVKSINELGHVMGIKTVAEFVEDEQTLARLRHIGIDYVQGYAIDKPSPLEQRFGLEPLYETPISVLSDTAKSR